jgi:GTP cyclohydrolase I
MAYKKNEQYDEKTTAALMDNYKDVLSLLGEDPSREGLLKTPERLAKAMQ